MTTIDERLAADVKDAMRAGDAVRRDTIRMARAALKDEEIKKGAALDDAESVRVLARLVKARRDAAAEFRNGGREDVAVKEEAEARLLEAYLPAGLGEAEVRAMVAEAVRETAAASPRDMGKVMKAVMPKVAGRADGALVNRLVREALGG